MMLRESTVIARRLRVGQTSAERELWKHLRGRKLGGMKFTRQHTIRYIDDGKAYFFIADFYCAQCKLCVEIDGSIHNGQEEYDRMRSSLKRNFGICTIHFSNEEVMNNIDEVLKKISALASSPLPLSHFPVRDACGTDAAVGARQDADLRQGKGPGDGVSV
ncbi:MAG: endonuclease domain-containing protein [Spirochaetota bacterium]